MPRASTHKPYVNFTGGLVTEATGLSYPENTARDLDNVDLHKSGKVSRRLAVTLEANAGTGDVFTPPLGFSGETAVTAHDWQSPGGDDTKHWCVIQVGARLLVRDLLGSPVAATGFSSGNEEFAIPVALINMDWDGATADEIDSAELDSATGLGRIFFTGPHNYPFYLEYDPDTDSISMKRVTSEGRTSEFRIQMRDFSGVPDDLDVDEHPVPLSEEHLYNLINQGWNSFYISTYFTSQSNYPSNSQQWFLGKDPSDNLDPALLVKQHLGTSKAPRGRIFLNILEGDRDNRWQLGTTPVGTFPAAHIINFSDAHDEPAGHGGAFKTIAFHAGRLWLSGDINFQRPNGVYFSQVIQNVDEDAGKFYQQNDPTSEHFSDVLATDGGVIYIPEATAIKKIVPLLEGLMVYADNGVWYIRGGDSGFSPLSYSVDKISSHKITSPRSVVEVETGHMFWSDSGIYGVFSESGFPSIQKASSGINSFYSSLTRENKESAYGIYDRRSEKVIWMYGQDNRVLRNSKLIFDLEMKAFSKYSNTIDEDTHIHGLSAGIASPVPIKVQKHYHNSAPVIISEDDAELQCFFVYSDTQANDAWFVQYASRRYEDLHLLSSPGLNYISYIETGDETLGDIARNKTAPYVSSFFDATELEYFLDPITNEPIAYKASGCLVTFKWDWHESALGNRWTRPQQAYRRRRSVQIGSGLALDNGEGIVYTKLKARGKGKALRIRYESEQGKDFQLLGFSLEAEGNAK